MDTATDDIAMVDRHDDCDGDGHDDDDVDDGVPRNSLLAAPVVVVLVDDGVDEFVDYYWTATGVRNDAVGCSLWNYSASSGGACEMWAQR